MKVSFKLSSVTNNVYEITLSSIDESMIDPELKSALRNLENLEEKLLCKNIGADYFILCSRNTVSTMALITIVTMSFIL